jgi:hypothetical protein
MRWSKTRGGKAVDYIINGEASQSPNFLEKREASGGGPLFS